MLRLYFYLLIKGDTLETLSDRVHRKLESLSDTWLLIYDNVEESIPTPQRGGHILFTSRSKDPFIDCHEKEVLPLSKEEGIEVLKNITEENESDEMRDLAGKLQGYPLVLGQIARYIRYFSASGTTIKKYLEESTRIDFSRMRGSDRYKQTLEQVLTPLFSNLPDRAQECLHLCAHLSPDEITKNTLVRWCESTYKESATKEEISTLLVKLVNGGWLRFNSTKETYSIHRLFQDVLQSEAAYKKSCKIYRRSNKSSRTRIYYSLGQDYGKDA